MSSGYSVYSRDTEQILFDVSPQARIDHRLGGKVHLGAEKLFEMNLDTDVAVEGRRSIESHQHVDVAAVAQFIARTRTCKCRQLATRRQGGWSSIARH